jgi:hypothetical protein
MKALALWTSLLILAQAVASDALKAELLNTWRTADHAFTPAVREAYLAFAKSATRAELAAQDTALPDDFFAWIAANPQVEATIYSAHDRPANLLLHLYSLRLDLGQERFDTYRQLALAAALVLTKQAEPADITTRPPLTLQIGGDPRQLIETNTPERPLDRHDHIINFLKANTIEEEVIVGNKEAELSYDKRGIAIKSKQNKLPILELKTRSLYAADVLASKELQAKFNAYMAEMGHPVDIDCGDKLVHWKSTDPLHGEHRKRVSAAYILFREAYEAKGLLPKARDPIPSVAERCRYIIRNYEHQFPAGTKRQWPQFPITAPWPVMTLLVDDDQPLREREERWLAFRDKGEFKKMGEYIGGIAQQFDIQSARRLKPHPFAYNSVQMMLKDGGVCGTMAAISARSHIALGIPACQAIQPGHCALVSFQYDEKTKHYACVGGQYATGGHEATTPFARWYLGEGAKKYRRNPGFGIQPNPRKPMVYHRSVAWAMNHGLDSFLDALMAHSLYQILDAPDRKAGGSPLLMSGLAHNPYALLVVDAAQTAAPTATDQVAFFETFASHLEAKGETYGCKPDGLFAGTVKAKVFSALGTLSVPEAGLERNRVFAFLQAQQCDQAKPLIRYRIACEGLTAVLAHTESEFKNHLIATRRAADSANDTACKRMEAAIRYTAEHIADTKERLAWAQNLWQKATGHELYIGRWDSVRTDPAITMLARQSKQKMPGKPQLTRSYLDRLSEELQASVAGPRELPECSQLAKKLESAAKFATDETVRKEWGQKLLTIMAGQETFSVGQKKHRDPCADAIRKIGE